MYNLKTNRDQLVTKDSVTVFGRSTANLQNIQNVSIGIAGPEEILSWSWGEVTNPETVSYRTFKPEHDGLFSARIFGPTRDYECQCLKYRRIKYRGITCDKCLVEVTTSRVRRERMAHISLVSPVSHILFLRGTNSPMASVLGMTVKDLERVAYLESYVVTDPGNTTLQKRQVLSESAYQKNLDEFGDNLLLELEQLHFTRYCQISILIWKKIPLRGN